jgi:hypothetical protein
LSDSSLSAGGHTPADTVDVFVSYAHSDDEIPTGAQRGWVTTFVGELSKVLRRKLGGSGAKVWMDHRLAANQEVTQELLDRIGKSSTLLLVMSPGYVKSSWCQRELANYVALATARGRTQSVFPIEIEPVDHERWPASIQSLTPIRFWHRGAEDLAPTLAGFPVPRPDEDSVYWRNVTELAHLIAQRLGAETPAEDAARKACVLVAEVTDDLETSRQDIVSALRQRGDALILPAMEYPRSNDNDFVASARSDLRNAALFVQLLGPYAGKRAPGSDRSFVAIQAHEALRHAPSVQVMQWRDPALDLERIQDPQHRELLTREQVSALGFEEFRRRVLQAIDGLTHVRTQPETAIIRHVAPSAERTVYAFDDAFEDAFEDLLAGPILANEALPAGGLSLYLQASPEDRDAADVIADRLADAGASVQLSPEPAAGQTFLESLMAQEEALRLCDGVLLLYGNGPVAAVGAAFQYALRVFGVKRPGVWSAVLDLPPREKQPVPIRSPNLMTIDSRDGFDVTKLRAFFESLRRNPAPGGMGAARHA